MNSQIKKMPKVVLHLHLDGSLRPETVKEELEKILNRELKLEDVKNLLMVERDCRDLNQYLEKFDIPGKVLQTKEQIERAVFELYEDLAKDNVIYAEVRFAPSKHRLMGLSYDEIVESSIKGLERAKSQFGIDGNLILCCMRGEGKVNKQENIDTVEVAKRFLGRGISAIDLAGAEALFKTKEFEDVFKLAKEYGIPFTIHAGEADGKESIKKALEFGTKRIGHGVRCIENKELMQELRDKGIVLEVCPISNMQTRAVEGKHPLEEIYRSGIHTTINTDNNTVSNTDIMQEYEWVLENTNLTIKDLATMNEYAAKEIFGTDEQKRRIEGILKRFKDGLEKESEQSEIGD